MTAAVTEANWQETLQAYNDGELRLSDQDYAALLWQQFSHLASTRRHSLARDVVSRETRSIPQLEAMIRYLKSPRCPVLTEQDMALRAAANRAVSEVSAKVAEVAAARPARNEPLLDGRYAIPSLSGNNDLDFYELSHGRKGSKWEHTIFVEQIVGGHENFPVKSFDRKNSIFKAIREMGVEASQLKAAQELGICMDCHRELTDELSRQLGRGPVCRSK